jgi:hypothetical protein
MEVLTVSKTKKKHERSRERVTIIPKKFITVAQDELNRHKLSLGPIKIFNSLVIAMSLSYVLVPNGQMDFVMIHGSIHVIMSESFVLTKKGGELSVFFDVDQRHGRLVVQNNVALLRRHVI